MDTAGSARRATGDSLRLGARQTVAWYLFAFAGSILVFNGGLYFPQWLVVDNHVGDAWYNGCLILTTVLMLLSAPALGSLSDKRYGRLMFLRGANVIMFLGSITLFVADHYIVNHGARVATALVAFVAILYSYQLSLVFHNTLLARVSRPEDYSKVSGRGVAWSLLGAIVGIVAVLPFVNGDLPFTHPGRGGAFLPSALMFGVLALPSLIWMPEDAPVQCDYLSRSVREVYSTLLRNLKQLPSQQQLFNFLLGYLVYMDVILTIEDNASIYLDKVMQFSDNEKAALYLLLLVAGSVGGFCSAYMMRRLSPSGLLSMVLVSSCVSLLIIGLTKASSVLFLMFGVFGFLFGALLNVSRVIFLLLVPITMRGEMFGIYASFERSASVLGPFMWSVPIILLPGLGAGKYRVAMVVMALLIALSLLFVRRMRREPTGEKIK